MHTGPVLYGEYEIMVRPERNAFGAWIASVSISRGDRTLVDVRPATVQPEWLTEAEAIRDGIDWARRFIDREIDTQQTHSWVDTRSRAERWFNDTEKPDSS